MAELKRENPFDVTKAVDFTDREIQSNFVDLPTADGGFGAILDPRSPMPRFVVGGKGGGRTHLMRHLSYALQTLDVEHKAAKIREDGYIGVYFRCSGLNASRFAGKGQDESVWVALFAYYMDLWFSRLLVESLCDISAHDSAWSEADVAAFRSSVRRSYDDDLPVSPALGLQGLAEELSSEIRQLDRAINNAALRASLNVEIKASPGGALFEMVGLVARDLLPGTRVTFLVDEFENLKESQQRYVNTLVREKIEACTFVIGSRIEGLRTFETLSAGEVNKAGSEFDITTLEDVYSSNRAAFRKFCTGMVTARIREVSFPVEERELKQLFQSVPPTFPEVFVGPDGRLRPHLMRLTEALKPAVRDREKVQAIVGSLAVVEDPLEEKLRILRFYQRWSQGVAPTPKLAADVRREFMDSEEGVQRVPHEFWKHHAADMLAQLYVEGGQKVPYAGFDQFVEMAGYLPRSLLVILKNTIRWSQFLGENPMGSGSAVSVRAQSEGCRDAAEWFLKDSVTNDVVGAASGLAIRRLGGFLRRMRYADKPVEVSCASFSTDRRGLTDRASATLDSCVKSGLLIEISRGQIDRNSGAFHFKFQLNPMLAPNFDLPTARRGVAKLSSTELNATFDSDFDDEAFDRVVSERLLTMNAPFRPTIEGQDALFD